MNQTVIVISVNQYQITKDNTSEIENEGTTVRYLLTEDLTHCEDKTQKVKGYKPAKANLPYEDYHKFQTVPGFYDLAMATKIDSQGKVSLIPAEFNLIGAISLNKGFGGGKAAGFGTKDKE
jgi:hypothetical protein